MRRLLQALEQQAPAGAFISLPADPPGVCLHQACGFRASVPDSLGMFRRLGRARTGSRL